MDEAVGHVVTGFALPMLTLTALLAVWALVSVPSEAVTLTV